MQDMNPAACSQAPLNVQKTLTDSRDDNTYTVARIKNQTDDEAKCWMTQNLEIINQTITPDDSDMVSGKFIIPGSSMSGFDSPSRYAPSAYWSSNGGYYNWYTATAGTGNELITEDGTNAPGSICPKGWRLPTGGNKTGEFYNLLNSLTVEQITADPYKYVKGGYVNSSSLNNAGSYGCYWSSTATSSLNAYGLLFTTGVDPSKSWYRYSGLSVRCVAR